MELQNHNMGVKNQISGGEISSKRVLCLEDKTRKKKKQMEMGSKQQLP